MCDGGSLTDGVLFGAHLATDGDPHTYWLSAGRTDALLTIDFGQPTELRALEIDWKHPARSGLVIASASADDNDWEAVAAWTGQAAATLKLSLLLADGGATMAQRLRLYFSDPVETGGPYVTRSQQTLWAG